MKNTLSLALVASLAMGCATAQDSSKPKTAANAPAAMPAAAPAKAGCPPPPKELVMKDLQKGSGTEVVQFRSAVLVGYTGWVYDGCAPDLKGEKFDSSDGRPTPFGFVVGAGRVIKGWDEGLIGMQKDGKRLLVIPPDKAYGARSPSPKIPANSTLVFEVALVDFVGGPPPAAQPAAPKK
ncbi:MAG TPA: FKBP-type peptidyl-prolyl cis-trans isomerase [Usitatibacter sp.]|nr:FKBP-type peptidyl-prolyl cis-trans isomerase [Usitatibacter sp.]